MTTTPIVINNINDLQAVQNNLSANYVLGANIDAAGFSFTPIGSVANPFTGIFDGQGHTISNLTINNVSNTDSGLFGDIGATGAVSNVGLINESVTSSYSNVGGIVGENFGTVSQSYVTGNVSGATYVGALVGFNGASGSITQSFATGTANGQIAGGLVGLNGGAISDSYATGAVNYFRVSVEAGGLVGLNSGSITQSYATGPVGNSGGFVLGGLVGGETAGSVTVSYWDTQTTGRSISGGGTGLTTAQLQSGILPAGFDPTIWLDVAGQFPGLRWQVSTDQPPTHDQISPYIYDNTVFDQTSDTAPLAPWFYFFSIGATFSTAGDYSAASATYPGLGSPQSLGLIAPTRFDFGSSAFTSFSALQAAYPFGTYTVTAVGNQISSTNSVSYQANYFTSTIPFVTNYSSLNGLNAANDFTVHYNSFAPDAHVTTGFTFLTIWNATTHQVVFQDDFQSSSSTTAQIPANTLSPNTNYTFELDFSDRLVVGSSTQGFDMRTDGSFTTGPIFQTNHVPLIDRAHSIIAGTINELPNVTGSVALDIASGAIAFTDADLRDRPTASVLHQTVTHQDALGHVFQLTDDQLFRFENAFLLAPESGNTNNGKIDWGYTIADKPIDFLGVGETVTITSTVEIDDGHGGKVDQDVTVTINGADDAPIVVPDTATVQKGSQVTSNVLANDSDPDLHDILHVTKVNGLDFNIGQPLHGLYGTLTLNASGSYTYTANTDLRSAASTGGHDIFSYAVDDGHGGSANSVLTVSVTVGGAAGLVAFPFAGGPSTYDVTQGPNTGDHTGHFKWSYDFNLPVGTQVLSVGHGRVVDLRDYVPDGQNTNTLLHPDASNGSGGFGNYVTIQLDDGTYVTYEHLANSYSDKPGVFVHIGDAVDTGTVLGVTGLTGVRTGPHLHVEFGSGQYHSGGISSDQLAKTYGVQNILADGISDKTAPEYFAELTVPASSNTVYNAGLGVDDLLFNDPTIRNFVVNGFQSGVDTLRISAAGFAHGLMAGGPVTLVTVPSSPSEAFHEGNQGYFIFESAGSQPGALFWDLAGGSGADAVQIATLTGISPLHLSDFHII